MIIKQQNQSISEHIHKINNKKTKRFYFVEIQFKKMHSESENVHPNS